MDVKYDYNQIAREFNNVVFQVGFPDSYFVYVINKDGGYNLLHLAIEADKPVLYLSEEKKSEKSVGVHLVTNKSISLINEMDIEIFKKKIVVANNLDHQSFQVSEFRCGDKSLVKILESF